MKNDIDKRNKYLYILHRWLFYSEKLAEQCNTWLSAEEGNANVMQNIEKRRKKIIIYKQ